MNNETTKTILFLTDFSATSIHALEFAINYCKKAKFQLHLLNAVDAPFSYKNEKEKSEIDSIITEIKNNSNSKLEGIKLDVEKKNGLLATYSTYTGSITEAVKDIILTRSIHKIVMGAKVNEDLFLKNSSFIIVQETTIPLLSVNINAPIKEFKTILFPFSERPMTLKKADEVIDLAKLYNAKIILLGISEANTIEKQQIIADNMMVVQTLFDENNIENEVHFVASDNYSEAILNFSHNNAVDLITIANNLSDTLKQITSATLFNRIINNAEIPVLTIPVRIFH